MIELDEEIHISFEDLKDQLIKDPTLITNDTSYYRALFHYCKDQ